MGKKKTPNKPQKKHREKKTAQRSGSTSEIRDQKGKKKRPREVDPQAKFETRKEKKTTQSCGSTSEIRDQKGKKKRPREVDPQRNSRPERKKNRPREVDPQAKLETRKEEEKNDPEKWIHKQTLRPERKKKKTTQRSGSTSKL